MLSKHKEWRDTVLGKGMLHGSKLHEKPGKMDGFLLGGEEGGGAVQGATQASYPPLTPCIPAGSPKSAADV